MNLTLWTEYPCTLMDPPWPENGGGGRGAQNHYPTIRTLGDIYDTIVGSPMWAPARAAHLWMWVTNNYLIWGCDLMARLGFRYITNWSWFKGAEEEFESETNRKGLGQYSRGEHELLLFGVRGKAMVPPPERRHGTAIFEPKREHSRKPEKSYRIIEDVSPGPRVELFAREERDGWEVWGNEVNPPDQARNLDRCLSGDAPSP